MMVTSEPFWEYVGKFQIIWEEYVYVYVIESEFCILLGGYNSIQWSSLSMELYFLREKRVAHYGTFSLSANLTISAFLICLLSFLVQTHIIWLWLYGRWKNHHISFRWVHHMRDWGFAPWEPTALASKLSPKVIIILNNNNNLK